MESEMTQVTDTLIDRMVRAIVDEVHPEQVILFGSRGRGDESQDSDVDLLVVEAEPFGKLIDYTPYAVEFRYQGIGPDADPIDLDGAVRLVEMLLDQVRQFLGE
jgi:predicted nucleotidyltransferase